MSREARVGLVVIAALGALATGVFLLGEREQLFLLKNRYSIQFSEVSGLAGGSPVQLNGVTVGRVEKVVLPERVEETLLKVWISLDRRFAARVREDSLARIKTLGLLGDKYIEISSGSSTSPVIASGGEIPAAPPTDVDRLIASGEDAVDNVVAISSSLRAILGRMERGEGLLGELLVDSDATRDLKASASATLSSLQVLTAELDQGKGLLGALLGDEALRASGIQILTRLETAVRSLDEGDGPLAALLHDEAMASELKATFAAARSASEQLAATASDLQQGDGLAARLLTDKELGEAVLRDLKDLFEHLAAISAALDNGQGTAGRLINDPTLIEAVDDVLVGVGESKLLRWLVRNRQRAGIRKRYEAERAVPQETQDGDQQTEPPSVE